VFRTRLLTAIVVLPIVTVATIVGDLPFLALVGSLLTISEVEFCRLLARCGYRPSLGISLSVLWLFLSNAYFPIGDILQPGLALILLLSLAWQLLHTEEKPIASWGVTVAGGLYLGACGSTIVSLRMMDSTGLWWTLLVVVGVVSADAGAYLSGSLWGRHKMLPAVSPGKTWEGYLGGLFCALALTPIAAEGWRALGAETVNGIHGLLLGLLIAAFSPLGDLAISLVKRKADVDDSGKLMPGHGGALDRIDTALWAAVIGYSYVQLIIH